MRSIDHFKDYYSGGYTHTDYQYDSAGNITKIREIREVESETQNPDSPGTAYDSYVEHTTSYEYDGLGRITTETEEGKRYLRSEYTYDERGNILSKSDYKFNMSKYIWELDKQRNYVYNSNGWKDQLVSSSVFSSVYDPSCCQYCNSTITENFSYNSLGNPTVYRSHSLAWERVNLLKQFGSNSFTYSADGMRLSKNNIRYDYLGDRLLKETRSNKVLRYYYGLDGVIGFNLRNVGSTTGTDYYFRKNLQGDVISVVSSTGDVCASYRYDAFGKCEIVTNINNIAEINPIRYRSYYFDTETGLYYLQTRYYDPEVGRFISPDSTKYLEPETINGLNLYAYCLNNPVMFDDETGHEPLPWWAKVLIGVGFIVAGAVVTALTAGTGAGFVAAFGAALLTSAKAVAVSTAISAGIGFAMGGLTTGTWEGAFNGLVDGAVDGFMWGGIFAGGAQILSGGIKQLAKAGIDFHKKGFFKVLTPNRLRSSKEISGIASKGQKYYEYGGTLVKVGRNYLDISNKTFLHMHLWFTGKAHIPIGTILAGIIGGF